MPDIRSTKIELLRGGPAHNQLLSPLTPYIALGGASAPQTVFLPWEHRQLLARLARLRYVQGGVPVPPAQREAELRELGEAVGRVLGQVPGLQSALHGLGRDGSALAHLRLSISALELSMVPFEAAIAPDHFPGSGAPLLLHTPTVITREIRRNEPVEVPWDRKPRILFAFATPRGLAPVPAQEHVNALRRAIEPYVEIGDAPADRLPSVRGLLTVLPEASLKDIADECRRNDYTHVHLLAHGAETKESEQGVYGIALRAGAGSDEPQVVDGKTLAIALCGAGVDGARKGRPVLVSLATCDSGAVDSVIVPGGSIAHALHEAGIPWVVASQFPLYMSGSNVAVDTLYGRLLAGEDPRRVLHLLRQRLSTEVTHAHDWASIVAYAVSPWDFEARVEAFRDRQVRARLDVRFKRMDALAARDALGAAQAAEFDQLAEAIRAEHESWIERSARRLETAAKAERLQQARAHAEALGMRGASEKRIAIAWAGRARGGADPQAAECALQAYRASRDAYRQALETDPTNHWAATQFLSVCSTPALLPEGGEAALRERYGDWWRAARQVAEWQLRGSAGEARAWALGTLAELDLLGSVYQGRGYKAGEAAQRVAESCRQIVESVGPQAFAVSSTRRQFQRYLKNWPHARWQRLAEAAVQALTPEP